MLGTKFVGIKMPIALSERLAQIARAENNSLSAVVRRLLTDGVERETAQKERRVL